MGKKRKSRGRTKGNKGSSSGVQCSACGRMIPRDKAKRVTSRRGLVTDRTLAQELEKQGARISGSIVDKYYCISCAIHRGICAPRERELRKETRTPR